MYRYRTPALSSKGFTVVELLIVIAVIAILAVITIVAYNGIQRQSLTSLLQADLRSADSQLSTEYVKTSGTYPDVIEEEEDSDPATYRLQFTDKAILFYTAENESLPKGYCLTGIIGDIVYHIKNGEQPVEGYCVGHEPVGTPPPPEIIATADSQSQITLTWEEVEEVASYKLERSLTDDFSGITTTSGITGTSYVVTGLAAATTYYFRMYSIGTSGAQSTASNEVDQTTDDAAPPGAPTISSLVVNSPTQITVNWTAVSGATSYKLRYGQSSDLSAVAPVTGVTGTSRAVTGLAAGKRYYFQMNAVVGSVDSADSNKPNATTTISAPDAPSVSVSIPGSARSASSGPWAKDYNGNPTSGNWYYAVAAVSSSTCASGTTRQQRARVQYNSPTTWGAWTGWTTGTSFYAIGPNTGYGARFQVQTRCYTSYYTSSGSTSGYGCRWRSGSTSCSGF